MDFFGLSANPPNQSKIRIRLLITAGILPELVMHSDEKSGKLQLAPKYKCINNNELYNTIGNFSLIAGDTQESG
jgi:hypothetical protein